MRAGGRSLLYDEYGGLIANPSARYSFNSEEMLRHSDGTFRVNLSRNARPENWLPSGAADQRLVLMLRIYSPRETDATGIGLIPGERLPKIERTVMRVRLPGLYIALGLVLAGLIHIVAVLALPMLAPKNGYARLAALGPANTMIQIPAAAPGQHVVPMMAPDVRYAFCRFDLAGGPVRLTATVADELLLIALYTPEGENFYSVVGADVKRAAGRTHHCHRRPDR